MKCVVCFNSCDEEYFNKILNWNLSRLYVFVGICCDENDNPDIEIKKNEIDRKISESDFLIILAGEHSYDVAPNCKAFRNWMSYTIYSNNKLKKKLAIVKLKPSSPVPMEAYGIGAEWIHEFSEEAVRLGLQNLMDEKCGFSDWKKQLGR